jgi:hypothetical protein
MTPTRPGTLALIALVLCVAGWAFARRFYGDIPRMSWFPAVTLFLLAMVEAILARATAARIARKPGTAPIEPLLVARFAALAKASSLGGAAFAGLYSGLLVFLFSERDRLTAASDDLPETAAIVLAAALLLAAALWLERACRIPRPPEDPGGP